jgi:hypothetical protein
MYFDVDLLRLFKYVQTTFRVSSMDGHRPPESSKIAVETSFYGPRRGWDDGCTVKDDIFALGSVLTSWIPQKSISRS